MILYKLAIIAMSEYYRIPVAARVFAWKIIIELPKLIIQFKESALPACLLDTHYF